MPEPGDCDRFRGDLAEVALAVLDPVESPGLVAHLARCPACRDELEELSTTADRLVLVAAEADPPDGFGSRVVDSMAPPASDPVRAGFGARPRRSVPSRAAMLVAAGVLLVALVGGGLFLAARDGGPGRDPVAASSPGADLPTARLVGADGSILGGLVVSDGTRPSMTVWLDGAYPGVEYRCTVVLPDGTSRLVGTWTSRGSGRSWTVDLDAEAAAARRVEVSLGDGTPWAGANLPG